MSLYIRFKRRQLEGDRAGEVTEVTSYVGPYAKLVVEGYETNGRKPLRRWSATGEVEEFDFEEYEPDNPEPDDE